MRISRITRRGIVDAIQVQEINWSGRLEEPEFLSRLFDLSTLPSKDSRFTDAYGDIWQHRINNLDWDDDWVFYDSRFNLLNGDDEIFLRFLCETIHPVVRPDATEAERLCQLYNEFLKNDGFQIVEKTRLSGKPVFIGRHIGVVSAPGISAAKELVETCCRTILAERNTEAPRNADLPQLIKLTSKELELTPSDIPEQAKAVETIRRLLSNLATITQGIAELRNQYGTGHGRHATSRGLTSRHAKLAVGAASTLAVFLVETHRARPTPSAP